MKEPQTLGSCGPVPYLRKEYRSTIRQGFQYSIQSSYNPAPSRTVITPSSILPLTSSTQSLPFNAPVQLAGDPSLILPQRPTSGPYADADMAYSGPISLRLPPPPTLTPGWITQPNPSSPRITNGLLSPATPPVGMPKLATSDLTFPSRPTPLPDISKILSSPRSSPNYYTATPSPIDRVTQVQTATAKSAKSTSQPKAPRSRPRPQ
jgi:hypothetical protein